MADATDYAATFKLFDLNGDGLISADELKQVFEKLGDQVSPEALTAMVSFLDSDKDGLISLEELTAYLAGPRAEPDATSAPASQDAAPDAQA